jgi:hypothetical protein
MFLCWCSQVKPWSGFLSWTVFLVNFCSQFWSCHLFRLYGLCNSITWYEMHSKYVFWDKNIRCKLCASHVQSYQVQVQFQSEKNKNRACSVFKLCTRLHWCMFSGYIDAIVRGKVIWCMFSGSSPWLNLALHRKFRAIHLQKHQLN